MNLVSHLQPTMETTRHKPREALPILDVPEDIGPTSDSVHLPRLDLYSKDEYCPLVRSALPGKRELYTQLYPHLDSQFYIPSPLCGTLRPI